MGLIGRVRRLRGVLSAAKGGGMREPMELQRKRLGVFFGTQLFELGQLASGQVDSGLKTLAQIKTSALVGCPF